MAQMGLDPPFKQDLPSGGVDSDVALAAAEAHGGATYRASQQQVLVEAVLARGLYPWDPSRATWLVQYSATSAEPLPILVDALSGRLLTAVEEKHQAHVPEYALPQNYPNPCNPMTVIAYQVTQKCRVLLEVLDPLGRSVAVIMDQEQVPGLHHVLFHAGHPPSGVYLYRIQMRDVRAVRKMVLR